MLALRSPDRHVFVMNDNEMDPRELYEMGFFAFVKALEVLSHDATTQCEEMGAYHTAWEIKDDVLRGAEGVLGTPVTALSQDQAGLIRALVSRLYRLPEDAISPRGPSPTSWDGCMATMTHPDWAPLRKAAAELLYVLAPNIAENEAYLGIGRPHRLN